MTLRAWLQRAPLLGFFALTFAWSWACWGLSPAIMLQDRFGWRAASLGLGLVWGVWHLPLFFIDGTAQDHIPAALFMLSVVAMSVVFAWLVNRTAGSVVSALVLHTAINFWPSVVPVLPTAGSYRAYAFVVAMLALLAFGLMAKRSAVDPSRVFVEAKP